MLTLIAFVQAGCGGAHPGPVRGVVLAAPASGVFDEPVHIVVTHVGADRELTVRLQSVDATGVSFSAQARFHSNAAGRVDLAVAPASGGGFYAGVNPMGLIETMQPASRGTAPHYYWKGAQSQRFDITVSEGASRVASGGFTRREFAPGVSVRAERIAATGFYGQFWAPPAGTSRHPAVLEFGGSEGGLHGQLVGAALASAGYPTLDIAYFGEPGIPATLTDIPLEYFARALRWLAGQPQVLKGQTYVMGASRGSEAALLLGAHYPTLVHGVIASSPSDVSHGSYPRLGAAAWTLHGKPVPHTTSLNPNAPANDPAAAIPVQDIRGPVFLDCGTDDQIWSSCPSALRIERHLTAARFAYPHVVYRYQGAGHLVDSLVPDRPGEMLPDLAEPIGSGDTLLANANAHARLWPQLLAFLAHPDRHTGVITAPSTPPPLTVR